MVNFKNGCFLSQLHVVFNSVVLHIELGSVLQQAGSGGGGRGELVIVASYRQDVAGKLAPAGFVLFG